MSDGFKRGESLSFCLSGGEEEGGWEVEETGEGGSVCEKSTAGLGEVREHVVEVDVEEDVDRAGDGEEDGAGAATEERKGVTAEGDKDEEDLGAEEEELVLEDVILLSE